MAVKRQGTDNLGFLTLGHGRAHAMGELGSGPNLHTPQLCRGRKLPGSSKS